MSGIRIARAPTLGDRLATGVITGYLLLGVLVDLGLLWLGSSALAQIGTYLAECLG